jgi:protein-S-isoprenylcysteine O-methyltransferase Ste14
MEILFKKTVISTLQLIVGLGIMLFVPAWTIDFWEAWVYLGVFGIAVMLINAYLFNNDPKLLEARLNRTEKERKQKRIQLYIFISYMGIFFLSSLDHRFMWSFVPVSIIVAGDILVALGYLIIFIVLRENTFAIATIEVNKDQKIISTGPYAFIRHPMYLGAIIMLFGTSFALGSWWGLLIFIFITGIIMLRLIEEERYLLKNLSGYNEYCQKVRYRLIPFIW